MARKKKELTLTPADQALEEAKGKFATTLVIGLNDKNQIDISSSSNSYVVLQWLLNRASFELLIHEQRTTAQQQEKNV